MNMMKKITGHVLWIKLTIIVFLFCTLPVLAEQASAESADFTVNTVPEPSALVLLALVGFLFKRMRGIKILCIALLALWVTLPTFQSYAAAPIVTNVTAQQQAWPLTDVDIYYDLIDTDGDSNYVFVAVSTNSGVTYNLVSTNFTGDVGHDILPGEKKHILWNAAMDLPQYSSSIVRVKISVDDKVPNDMVLIPAGAFEMGNHMDPEEGGHWELPVHTVYISAFYIDTYEVTKKKWDEVYNWALLNGYGFSYTGSVKNINHPVHSVSWVDCVKWCNARSEKEGKVPCYYTDSSKTILYKEGYINLTNNCVMWEADGYRLPTEAEWEKAARGGTTGRRFPWSDTDIISHERANYFSGSTAVYDVNQISGYHPDYDDGVKPYTSPVGTFAPNVYGLYDMAGNLEEYCWDYYLENYYGNSPDIDPHGPLYYFYRIRRGGGWHSLPSELRCANRETGHSFIDSDKCGFRCVFRCN
jgi:formylglycine-generating enzyme required for sulfatase activity